MEENRPAVAAHTGSGGYFSNNARRSRRAQGRPVAPVLAMFNLPRLISLKSLIPLGFVVAILPLIATLAAAVGVVDGLAASSATLAYRVAGLSRQNELLRERLVDFERKAKRYLVLDDPESRAALDEAHRDFGASLDGLAELLRDTALMTRLDELRGGGEAIYRRLPPPGPPRKPNPAKTPGAAPERPSLNRADALFDELGAKAREFARALANVSGAEVHDLESQAASLRQRLLLECAILLPASLALVGLLTFLIIRPVRQMDLAIRRLGAGDLVRPIRVVGPKDLEYLGERLDWLRERQRALEAAKQRFMRHVSHELKTPLATLHEGTELLADEVVGELNPEQRDIAQILLSNTHKLDTLIVELINYSQVNARPSDLRREQVDMTALARTVIEDYQIRLRSKALAVKAALKPVRLHGNPEQLRTILDNLLSNAVKYSPNGGEIRLALQATGGKMELEIEDDGPGIDPEEREQVFEPFFQGRAAKAGQVGGTGLGLAIMSECVAGHQGKVEALEPHPGQTGARFRVSIPLRQDG